MAVLLTAMVFRPLWILLVVASIALVVEGVLIASNYNNVNYYIWCALGYVYIIGGVASTGLGIMMSSVPVLETMGLWILVLTSLIGLFSLNILFLWMWIDDIKIKREKQNKRKRKKQKS